MSINDNTPLVCLSVPTYNAEATIRQTLTSLLRQSYQNIQIHIVDNCSTDRTLEIVRTFLDSRLKIFESTENIGAEANFNRCIELSIGQYTAIYHADDIYEPEMVQQQVAFLSSYPDVAAVFTEAHFIDEHAKLLGHASLPLTFKNETNIYTFFELFKGILKHSNFLFCPSAMVKTDVYKNDIVAWRGGQFGSSADLDVWLRIASKYLIGIIPTPLMNYRISNAQWSEKVRRETKRADFFLVMDFYLNQAFVKNSLTQQDLINYQNLERRDRVMRAVNLFLQNKGKEAKALCYDVPSRPAFKEAFNNKRGQFTLVFAFLIKFFLLIKVESTGRKMIGKIILKLNK